MTTYGQKGWTFALSKGVMTNVGGVSNIMAMGARMGPNTSEVSSSAGPV